MSITSTLTVIGAGGSGGFDSFIYEATSSGGTLTLSAVTTDSEENIIVAGKIATVGVYILKLDPFGNKLWDKTIDGTANFNAPSDGALLVDSSDNIYLNTVQATTNPNRVYKLDGSDGSAIRYVNISNITTRASIDIGSNNQIWVAGGWSAGPGMVVEKFDTNLDDTHAYYFRGNDNVILTRFIQAYSNGDFAYVYAQDRDGSFSYLNSIDYFGGTVVTQQDNYLSDFDVAVPPPFSTNYAPGRSYYIRKNSSDYIYGNINIDGSSLSISVFASFGLGDPYGAAIIYHSDYNASTQPDIYFNTAAQYGGSGLMLGGRKTGGLDENYAYIYQSTSVTGSSTFNKVLAITGADGDRVLSMVHLPTSDFLVAGLGASGFTLIKIPAAFDTAGLSGTYGSVTLADKTGDFIQQSASALDNRPSGQLTVNTRTQVAPTTSVSTTDATGITKTITKI